MYKISQHSFTKLISILQQTQSGPKCIVCGVITHLSCAKAMKTVKLIDEKQINCCLSEPSGSASDKQRSSSTSADARLVEVKYLKELIKQKDMLIETQAITIRNQGDLIDNLNNQLKKQQNVNKGPAFQSRQSGVAGARDVGDVAGGKSETSVRDKNRPGQLASAADADGKETTTYETPKINPNAGSSATKSGGDTAKAETGNEKFTTVVRRKHGGAKKKFNSPVVGERSAVAGCALKAAVRLTYWHLYNLDPDTTVSDITNYLKPMFPEVQVDPLKSRNPEAYSSFKVAVSEHNREEINKPSLWPSGARLNRFFLPRTRRRGENVDGGNTGQ